MKTILLPTFATLTGLLRSRAVLHLEILALRQQLAMVASREPKRLRFRRPERLFWVWLYRLWPGCLATLAVFKADTLVRWHRKGFRLYWAWKSRRNSGGRPTISPETRDLIRRLSQENPLWESAKNRGVWRPPRHQDDVAFGQVDTRRMRSCQISTSFASFYAMSAP